MSMRTIPAELLHHCAEYLDVATLKNFRLASRATSVIGVEYLFHTVVLNFNAESTERFGNVLESVTLRPLVKKIIINGAEGNCEKEWDENYNQIDTPWSLAIPKIAQLPSVCEVEMKFDDECDFDEDDYGGYKQSYDYRVYYQKLFFAAVAESQNVDSLTIDGLQDRATDNFGSEETCAKVLGKTKKLALMIVSGSTEPSGQPDYSSLRSCISWRVPLFWLEPTQAHLTHLTLSVDDEWGVLPFMDVQTIHFPNLKSLALGNYTVAHEMQVNWILRHGATLEELTLSNCAIIYAFYNFANYDFWEDFVELRLIDLRWSDVFAMFKEKLQKLKHFRMANEPSRPTDYMISIQHRLPAMIQTERYKGYKDGGCPTPWMNDISAWADDYPELEGITPPGEEQDAKDQEALDMLLREIGKSEREIERMKILELRWVEGRGDNYYEREEREGDVDYEEEEVE